MTDIIDKSKAVLQELEDKLRENKLQKIKSEIVPLTYSPSAKKKPLKMFSTEGQESNYNIEANFQNKDQINQFRELLTQKKIEFNTICDSLMAKDLE